MPIKMFQATTERGEKLAHLVYIYAYKIKILLWKISNRKYWFEQFCNINWGLKVKTHNQLFSLQVISASLFTTDIYKQWQIIAMKTHLFCILISSKSNTFDMITRHETHASYTTVCELCLVFLHFPPFCLFLSFCTNISLLGHPPYISHGILLSQIMFKSLVTH